MYQPPVFISDEQVRRSLNYPELIEALAQGFNKTIIVPQRQHLEMSQTYDSTLLLMPAWTNETMGGIKMVTIFPQNSAQNLPSIQGIYTVFDTRNGRLLAQLDAKLLTNLRTAATSALAARFLSRNDSSTLLVMGTGTLAPELVKAHCTIRPIRKVLIWGRNPNHQAVLADHLATEISIPIIKVDDPATAAAQADIITCATMSEQPILLGDWVKSGTHIDLVGSYKPHLREADDTLIQKSALYVDTIEGATKESGDLAIPIASGVLSVSSIRGTIFGLSRGEHKGRQNAAEITLFKSVGHAAEDLIAAQLLLQKLNIG